MAKPVTTLQPAQQRTSLVQKMGARYSIDPEKLLAILSATAFKQSDGKVATNEQMAALLVVADQYGLNPFTREIYAFADKRAGIVPVVGVDGWSRIINDHPQSDGFDFRESENKVTPKDGKPCPEWMEVVIYRKDRAHPIVVREYIDEVYQGKRGDYAGPWQSHTKRMFRHKVLIQGARIAYGFGGIYDEDEAQRIIDMGTVQAVPVDEKITDTQAADIKALAEEVGADVPLLLSYLSKSGKVLIPAIEDIPANMRREAVLVLEQKRTEANAAVERRPDNGGKEA